MNNVARMNVEIPNGVRYTKLSNQRCMPYQASGKAITRDTPMSRMKSLASNVMTSPTLAPRTFRMLISLFRCSAAKLTSPKSPRHATSSANAVKSGDDLADPGVSGIELVEVIVHERAVVKRHISRILRIQPMHLIDRDGNIIRVQANAGIISIKEPRVTNQRPCGLV